VEGIHTPYSSVARGLVFVLLNLGAHRFHFGREQAQVVLSAFDAVERSLAIGGACGGTADNVTTGPLILVPGVARRASPSPWTRTGAGSGSRSSPAGGG
jgi:hypothetical protein